MCFACIGTPQKDEVCLFHLAIRTGGATRSENRRQTGDARCVSSAVAAVDVVAADHRTNEFLRDVVQFICGLGAAEHPEGVRPVDIDLPAKSGSRKIQSFWPACGPMATRAANERSGESVLMRLGHFLLPLGDSAGESKIEKESKSACPSGTFSLRAFHSQPNVIGKSMTGTTSRSAGTS